VSFRIALAARNLLLAFDFGNPRHLATMFFVRKFLSDRRSSPKRGCVTRWYSVPFTVVSLCYNFRGVRAEYLTSFGSGVFFMLSSTRKFSVVAVLATLVVASGCTGFFVNPTLSSLAIGPQSATITASPVQTLQMSATGTYSDGSTKDLTGKVLWNSATPGCATISSSGLVTPVSSVAGICTTQISASFGTASPATTTITVAQGVPSKIQLNASTTTPAANSTVTFTALATFNGVQQDITTSVTWTNSDTTDLTLTNGSGVGTVAAGASGKPINVTANFNGVSSNTVLLNVQ